MYTILTINPGSTSTKLGLYHTDQNMELEEVFCNNVMHDVNVLKRYKDPIDQLDIRLKCISDFIDKTSVKKLDCIVSRGGLIGPVSAGSYVINDKMLNDLKSNRFGRHVSNVSPLLAKQLSKQFNCPAFIVDPVAIDEFTALARYSGFKEIERRSQWHALNVRAIIARACQDLNVSSGKANFIIAHLGGGITIAASSHGKVVDVSNAIDGGPFSPNRAGSLPTTQLVNLCFSGGYQSAKELNNVLTKQSGLVSYLGTDNAKEIFQRINEGDKKAKEVFHAMAYQIGKEIGSMAVVLKGKIDAILLTGGLARPTLVDLIKIYTGWIASIHVYPGGREQEALAEAGARFLSGKEQLKQY